MNERQKAVLREARDLKGALWKVLEERLPPREMGLVRSWVGLMLYVSLLEGGMVPGPEFNRAEMWRALEEGVEAVRAAL